MPLSPSTVANFFLEAGHRENVPVTPLMLQKLVYFAHGWYVGFTGEPLIDQPVEAWKYGPVVPSLYHEFKDFGNSPITRLSSSSAILPELARDVLAAKPLLERVWKTYSKYTASQLSALSHHPNGPWARAALMQNGPVPNRVIPESLIRDYFEARANKTD